jgi:hypothetical protein
VVVEDREESNTMVKRKDLFDFYREKKVGPVSKFLL